MRALYRADERFRASVAAGAAAQRPLGMVVVALAGGLLYGASMGSYSVLTGGDPLLMIYATIKVPMLLLVTLAIALPSFFVLSSLAGLRDDFAESLRAILGAQTVVAVILASLSPFTILFYASTTDYLGAVFFSVVMFAIAGVASQLALHESYRGLVARNGAHRRMKWLWIALYAFVCVQMAWVLRPFFGVPGGATEFFRVESWGNAYEVVMRLAVHALL
jgi:hypothetical protein